MDTETYLKPNVSEEFAKDLALRLYGLEVLSINRMVSFDDQNFHILVSKKHHNPYISQVLEGGYTLKITNVNRSVIPDHFDSMHAAMTHLSEKGLSCPVPVRTLEGRTWKLEKVPLLDQVADSEGDKLCGIHLLTYLPGVPISKVPYTPQLLYQWGQLLAKYHLGMQDFHRVSLLEKDFLWKLENIPKLKHYMDGMEKSREELVNRVLDKFSDEIEKNMEKLPKGIIHGDFNENNVLVETDPATGVARVEVILDFEDIHRGTYVWDLGVMLAYTMLDCRTLDPLDGAGHAMAGYLSRRELTDLEMRLAKMCIQCRLCQSLVLCGYSYKTDPTNTYLLNSSKTGWDRLAQISNIGDEELLQKWRRIQEEYKNGTFSQ